MAGFGLEGFEERIPCPHCGGTDCCGITEDKNIICIVTGKRVTQKQLLKSARKGQVNEKREKNKRKHYT